MRGWRLEHKRLESHIVKTRTAVADMIGQGKKLFRLFGFEVRVDWSWLIIATLIAWSLSVGLFPFYYRDLSTKAYWIMGILGVLGLFASLIVHEFCHSLVARKYGIPVKGITLFLFGGVAQIEEEPVSPKAEFLMAVVGPLSSIGVALVFYGLYIAGKASLSTPVTGVLGYLASINVILAVFNLLPAFPLDGGRMLRSVLWGVKKDLRRATRIASAIGAGFGILLIVIGLFRVLMGNFIGGMWFFLIGLFLRSAAKTSYQQLIVRRALEGEPVSRFMKTDPIVVPLSASIEEWVNEYVYKFHHKMFPVVENGNKLTGCITTDYLKRISRENWSQANVGEVAAKCGPDNTIEPNTDAVKALSIMKRNDTSRLMVVEGDELVGIITLKDLMAFISLKVELEE